MTCYAVGAYDEEEAAARAYDLAALKYWGPGTLINFRLRDYSRDLEEMQNITREDYLVSLRRKSSSFSRGVDKYIASRYDFNILIAQNSVVVTEENDMYIPFKSLVFLQNSLKDLGLDSINVSEGTTAEMEYPGDFDINRRLDLTSYIKWWVPNKIRRTDSLSRSLEETRHCSSESIASELQRVLHDIQPGLPFQIPCLDIVHEGQHKRSALSIFSKSAAYKSLQEKAIKEQENRNINTENKNYKEMDYGKEIQKSVSGDDRSEGFRVATGSLPSQIPFCPLNAFASGPLLTNYNAVDPLVNLTEWKHLVSLPPRGLSLTTEVSILIYKYSFRSLQL
ncbi:hypothetical protein GIB67_040046 [Kingdonia uniflora]|uniref:AP2/ERF domain-containing protein n=1 Tax=Kingdonia uniflora TaxID=39325 RepID=A0A7J7MUQ6_9MAGN|nr:hypothetical protein GIB67_040046 [Kingdonia uniflora]